MQHAGCETAHCRNFEVQMLRSAHRDAARRAGRRIGSPADTNGGMSSEALTVKALTRRLVAREAGERDESVSVAHIVHGACEHACRALSRSIGPTGFHALLLRALAQVENEHPTG